MNFGKTRRLHFVGIGGIGMSGIAEILLAMGYEVTGSDLRESEITRRLESKGARIFYGHDRGHVEDAPPDVVVISSAVREDNVEVQAAVRRKIPVIRRAEMLAELMRMKYGIAIAGTHGKTTTTSMVGSVLLEAGLDPTIIVGGRVADILGGSNARKGMGEHLVVEADEFDHSFLKLHHIIGVITNIEAEHLDCYEDLEDIRRAFSTFANRVPFFGVVVCCLDDDGVRSILPSIHRRFTTYGFSAQADVQACDVVFDGEGSSFTVRTRDGDELGRVRLAIPGRHNVSNALAAVCVGLELSLPFERICGGLERFKGVERRFQLIGRVGGVHVVDDYAHHPTEIEATLETAEMLKGEGRIVAVFQPHLYSRTKDFADAFGRSFYRADKLVVTDVYPSREEPIPGVSGRLVADAAIQSGHRDVLYVEEMEEIVPVLQELVRPGDWVITLGAGNVNRVAYGLLEALDGGRECGPAEEAVRE